MERKDSLFTVGENVIGFMLYGKEYGDFSKKVGPEPSYNPPIPLLGIHPQVPKTLIRKDICTLMFTVVLSTIAKIWKTIQIPNYE